MIEQDLYTALSTATAITALSGTNIFPLVLPTDPTLPAITYQFVGGRGAATMSNRGTQRSRVQIDCWGTTYLQAVTLRNAVIDTLAGYTAPTFTSQLLQTIDDFDHELLQYTAKVEFYLTYSL